MSGIVGRYNLRGSGLIKSLQTSAIADDAITLAKMVSGTDGQIITYDASGNPSAVGPGSDGQVLTSTGAGSPPAFEAAASGFTAASITGGTDYGNISPATGDSIIMHDTSASALREITIANLGNTPAFSAYDGGADSVSTATWTKGQFSGEHYDTHSAFDSSTNYRFTVPTGCGGNYIFSYAASVLNLADAKVHQMHLYINGSIALNSNTMVSDHNSHTKKTAIRGSCMISLDADDYVELFHYHNHGSSIDTLSERMHFSGFRLAGS